MLQICVQIRSIVNYITREFISAFTKLQKIGLVVLIGSLLIGFGGTVWSIYGSFVALATAENVGIGPVGDSIRNALIFTVLGIVGLIAGILMMILGDVNVAYRKR